MRRMIQKFTLWLSFKFPKKGKKVFGIYKIIMKNINQIFKNNKHLIEHPEVQELIDYCRELEGKFMEVEINKQYDKEDILINVIRDIKESCEQTINDNEESIRFNEIPRVDFEKCVVNLKKYIETINSLYKIGL